MSNLDAATQENIQKARTFEGTPSDEYLVPYPSLGDLLDRRAAETAHKVFLIHYDGDGLREEFTYAELNQRANQIANFLIQEVGVKAGDRVATMAYNHADTVMIYFACWKIGAAVAPQNVSEDDDRINFILRNSESVALLVRPEYMERAESIVAGAGAGQEPAANIRLIIQTGGEPDGKHPHLQTQAIRYETSLTAASSVTPDSECLLLYTSGTTGSPKGVVLTHYNNLSDAYGIATWHGITADQRLMCVLPIHHANGIEVTLITPLFAGASTVLNRAYSSSHFWERIAKEDVQIVSVVPTLLQFSLDYAAEAEKAGRSIWGEGVSREDLARFRHLICGAGTLAVSLATEFEEKLGVRIVHGYGLSETTCYSCFLPPDLEWDEHRSWMKDYGYPSIGVPIPPNEMAIFDLSGSGQQLGAEERGEICVRGHNVMKHYFNRPEANTETFKFGWFRTGDEGFYEEDAQGRPFFFITGRIKELINRGGVKFSPFDIEEVLLELPEVKSGLAIAFENDYYGEEVGAYVVLHEGKTLSEDQILAHCRERMTFEKSPKVVVFGTDIPVTATGKYQRLKLHDQFVAWKHTQFRG